MLGIAGEPLSSFVFAFFKWLKKRRVISKNTQKKKKTRKKQTVESPFLNPVAEYLPIEKIENGIIYTKDHRYIKIVEVIPINFMLRSAREQRNMCCLLS